jgi:hypothetical protein
MFVENEGDRLVSLFVLGNDSARSLLGMAKEEKGQLKIDCTIWGNNCV